jgi:hypothetical protein
MPRAPRSVWRVEAAYDLRSGNQWPLALRHFFGLSDRARTLTVTHSPTQRGAGRRHLGTWRSQGWAYRGDEDDEEQGRGEGSGPVGEAK